MCVYVCNPKYKKKYFIQEVLKKLMGIKRWMDMRNKSLVGVLSQLAFQISNLENDPIYGVGNGTKCLRINR